MGFPLIEKMGLKLICTRSHEAVIAEDLERALEKATVVWGSVHEDAYWNKTKQEGDTHKALLINVEELSKEPCKHEPELKMMGLKEIVELPFNAPLQFMCRKCLKKIKATEWVEEIRE